MLNEAVGPEPIAGPLRQGEAQPNKNDMPHG
jgi:hypothetical protein